MKANFKTVGLDSGVPADDCFGSLHPEHRVNSILQYAQNAQMATGFVTTARVTHATPAALYAKSANREWECETKMKPNDLLIGCKDIARQLVEDAPGRNLNVIMGGGRQSLLSNVTATENDPKDNWGCYSNDGRDLISDWLKIRTKGRRHVASTSSQLMAVNASETEYLMGMFHSVPFFFVETSPKTIFLYLQVYLQTVTCATTISSMIRTHLACHR